MDQTDYQSLESWTHQFVSSQFPKKVTHLLLSVSLFSLLFSYTSWYSFFLQSLLKLNSFSEFFSQLLSHTMDKNCIFLICNGILVFLAKTSGLIRFSPQLPDLNNHHSEFKKIEDEDEDGLQSVSETESLVEKEVPKETTEPQENVVEEEEEEEEKEELNTQGEEGAGIPEDEENGRELGNIVFLNNEEDEEEEEENKEDEANGLLSTEELNKEDELSTEELNKKCDEFIRRMKKEIMIGAQ